jgi:ABC-type dipeptide/oligopeptide/nickel transport system permease component
MAPDPEEPQATFTLPLLGALYSSLVLVVLVALLNSHLGRDLDHKIDAPARTMIAAPVIVAALVVFIACVLALIQPVYRRPALRVAEICSWLIPAWLVMGAMVLGAISFALNHAD